jgi:hypothetical protein
MPVCVSSDCREGVAGRVDYFVGQIVPDPTQRGRVRRRGPGNAGGLELWQAESIQIRSTVSPVSGVAPQSSWNVRLVSPGGSVAGGSTSMR